MLLNCDLGESFGSWSMGHDAAVMPYIDQANIACGFHAGDPVTVRATLALAAEHGVAVGAHPAYPDIVGFGRRHMTLSRDEIVANLHYQIAALEGMAQCRGLTLAHVKPHGALYHDMMSDHKARAAIMEAMGSYHRPLPLMMLSTVNAEAHRNEAEAAGVSVLFEAFADRSYDNQGSLVPRNHPNAVHSRERMLAQVQQLQQDNSVTTIDGNVIPLQVDTLCVHGDNREAVLAIEAIRTLLNDG